MSLDLKEIMLNLSTNIFIAVDADGNVIACNDRASVLVDSNEVIGRSLRSLFSSYVFHDLKYYAAKTLKTSLPANFVIDIGSRIYDCKIYPYTFGFVIYFDDITVLKHRSEEINEFARRMDLAQHTSKLGYFEVDLENKKYFFSKELYYLLGLKKKKASDVDIVRQQVCSNDLAKLDKVVDRLIKQNKKIDTKIRFVKKDSGELIHCFLKANLICDGGCKLIGTIQDLTNVIENEKKLKAAKRRAENMAKARVYFIAQASHDLRQPIQAMRLFIHALKDEKLNAKQKNMVSHIDASAESLNALLDNLIDISKLDYGGERYHPYAFALSHLMKTIVEEFESIAQSKNVVFKADIVDIDLYSNPFFIERIVRNLLSNAFKYTDTEVCLSIKKKGKKDIVISVQDNGQGIKRKELKIIFDEFFQSEYRKEGVGLGLPIVKKMTDLLDGKIDVKSKADVGSNFLVTLPINKKA